MLFRKISTDTICKPVTVHRDTNMCEQKGTKITKIAGLWDKTPSNRLGVKEPVQMSVLPSSSSSSSMYRLRRQYSMIFCIFCLTTRRHRQRSSFFLFIVVRTLILRKSTVQNVILVLLKHQTSHFFV